ncbi:MAG: D-alanyl-D-alanine carboxypeptidase [Clostridiaceae bacterium]|nr:D-alanyl-D-alanine carboxypeptidase [Clostridiaceae bacterium]
MKLGRDRTIRRRTACFFLLVYIISHLLSITWEIKSFAQDEPLTEAASALLFDARRGQVIISKSPDELTHSSLAHRIMTALITLEKADAEATVTASKDAASTEGATLNLSVGEKYSVRNLLYALVLTGSPDAAKAIAEYVGGSEDGFVKLMNEHALKLGMSNTVFVNCTGEYDENQHTTANDISILIRHALTNSEFNRFFGTQAKPWYDKTKTILLTSTNNMFWSYTGTDGGMTASSDKDVHSIITTATKNNMRLVCLLLDVPSKSMYSDSINFLDYGFENYLYGTLVPAGASQRVVTVDGQNLNLVPAADVYYIYPKGQKFIKDISINVDESKLKPPITKNTIVGMLTYTLMDDTVIKVDLYPDREILPKKTTAQILRDRIKENMELIYVIIGLIILEIIMGIVKLTRFIKRKAVKVSARRRSRGRLS